MRDLNYDLKRLGARNRDGGRSAQANRARILSQLANQLHELGYKKLRAVDLKGRHVNALVKAWQDQELSPGTMKNRMAALRWWAEKVGRRSVIARDNTFYGIPKRQFVAQESKAKTVNWAQLEKVRDAHVRLSLELQREFGLRREEAMKFQPSYADRGVKLVLKPSWTKGGKAREIPIRTDAQREVLGRAHKLAGRGSLIPPNRSYVQHLKIYERHTVNAGLHKMHGLRHAYAQNRYKKLTGRLAPAAGGVTAKELSSAQRDQDREVRLLISRELGHEREQITTVYLGR